MLWIFDQPEMQNFQVGCRCILWLIVYQFKFLTAITQAFLQSIYTSKTLMILIWCDVNTESVRSLTRRGMIYLHLIQWNITAFVCNRLRAHNICRSTTETWQFTVIITMITLARKASYETIDRFDIEIAHDFFIAKRVSNNACTSLDCIAMSHLIHSVVIPWWRHQMETFSRYWLFLRGIHRFPVPGEFPTQRPVTRRFDVFFDLRLNKRFSKQSWGWWFEALSRLL